MRARHAALTLAALATSRPGLAPATPAAASATATATAAAAASASATASVAPPVGWEESPPLPSFALPSGKLKAAACCRNDTECCTLQSEIDAIRPLRVSREFSVKASELPKAAITEAPADKPGIPEAPGIVYRDGRGSPPPWPGGPKENIRMFAPGRFGEIRYNDDGRPHFEDKPCWGMGYGIERTTNKEGQAPFVGRSSFLALNKGEGGALKRDQVAGVFLDNKMDLLATLWSHAEAAPVAEQAMHAHIGKVFDEKHEKFDPVERVVFTLPEVIFLFDVPDAIRSGGFFPSRFSTSVAYTEYGLPIEPGSGSMAEFDMRDTTCWFSRDLGKIKKAPFRVGVLISATRTAAEAEPRIKVIVFE